MNRKFLCSMIRLKGFRIVKFSRVENSKRPPLLKIAKLLKSPFSPERLGIFGWKFVWSISGTLLLIDIKMKKKSIAELSHNGRLKIYVDPRNPFKIHSNDFFLKPLHPWILNFIFSMVRRQGFRIVQFRRVNNSRWPPLLKNSKTNKIVIFSRTAKYFWLKFCTKYK